MPTADVPIWFNAPIRWAVVCSQCGHRHRLEAAHPPTEEVRMICHDCEARLSIGGKKVP